MESAQHLHYLAYALNEARKAESKNEVPVGAVIVQNGIIIGRGHNQKESSHDPTGHAELRAIRQAARKLRSWRLERCTLYSTLEPCPMCAGAILHARIEKVIFGAKDLKWGAAGTIIDLFSQPLFNHKTLTEYCASDACSSLLTSFFRKKRR